MGLRVEEKPTSNHGFYVSFGFHLFLGLLVLVPSVHVAHYGLAVYQGNGAICRWKTDNVLAV